MVRPCDVYFLLKVVLLSRYSDCVDISNLPRLWIDNLHRKIVLLKILAIHLLILLINRNIQKNLQECQNNKEQFINTLIILADGSKNMPFSLLTPDLWLYLFCYIFSDNIIYQQMERQKIVMPFFTKIRTCINETKSNKQNNSMTPKIP